MFDKKCFLKKLKKKNPKQGKDNLMKTEKIMKATLRLLKTLFLQFVEPDKKLLTPKSFLRISSKTNIFWKKISVK